MSLEVNSALSDDCWKKIVGGKSGTPGLSLWSSRSWVMLGKPLPFSVLQFPTLLQYLDCVK